MLFFLFALGIPLTLIQTEAYVLLQVRKHDTNHSNVDAFIHKVVPSGKLDKFAKRMENDAEENPYNSSPTNQAQDSEEQLNSAMAIPETTEEKEPNFMDIITLAGSKFMKRASGPMFRAIAKGYFGTGQEVESGSDQTPVHNIPSGSIVGTVNDMLSSVTLRKYVDKLSRKAAAVVGTVEYDMQPIVSNLLRFKHPLSA